MNVHDVIKYKSITSKRRLHRVDIDVSSRERENEPVGVAEEGGMAF